MSEPTELEERLLREHFSEESTYLEARKRLENHEPLGYIIGEWYFYNETYRLNRDCLIPRPETEHLLETLIEKLPKGGCFADLCTGSGCIAISALVHRPDATALAADLSAGALSMAELNAGANGVSDRIRFRRADVLRDTPALVLDEKKYDIIVSNPPYIDTAVIASLSPEVRFEPRLALDGGADGMDFYRVLLAEYLPFLKPDGLMLLEIGYDQAEKLQGLHPAAILKDYSGNDRVAIVRP